MLYEVMASPPKQLLIDGSVSSGYEPVREAFIENFDLWGGVRDRVTGEP
jgi:hypothetical protein